MEEDVSRIYNDNNDIETYITLDTMNNVKDSCPNDEEGGVSD